MAYDHSEQTGISKCILWLTVSKMLCPLLWYRSSDILLVSLFSPRPHRGLSIWQNLCLNREKLNSTLPEILRQNMEKSRRKTGDFKDTQRAWRNEQQTSHDMLLHETRRERENQRNTWRKKMGLAGRELENVRMWPQTNTNRGPRTANDLFPMDR